MRVIKYILPIFVLSLISVTLLAAKPASAMASVLECSSARGNTNFGCDIAIDKQVSVGSSSFAEAQTSATAVPALVGDTVTWKITINNNSYNKQPIGTLTVKDVLPAGVTYDSYSATDGTYTNTDGDWTFDLASKAQPVLTIVSTVNSTGITENTADMNTYTLPCGQVDPFSDFNASNNSASAYITVTAPAVTTTTTTTTPTTTTPVATPAITPSAPSAKAPDTGFSVSDANVDATVLSYGLVAVALAGIGFKLRALAKLY